MVQIILTVALVRHLDKLDGVVGHLSCFLGLAHERLEFWIGSVRAPQRGI